MNLFVEGCTQIKSQKYNQPTNRKEEEEEKEATMENEKKEKFFVCHFIIEKSSDKTQKVCN